MTAREMLRRRARRIRVELCCYLAAFLGMAAVGSRSSGAETAPGATGCS